MKLIKYLISIVLFFFMSFLYAKGKPLKIAIDIYTPPFVMERDNYKLYGFDIDMMSFICKKLNRNCQYVPMKFEALLDAVASGTVDVAVSAITITSERASLVNFTMPYMLGYSRFLTDHITNGSHDLSMDQLKDKRIGVLSTSIFKHQIRTLGIKHPVVVEYANLEPMMEDLKQDKIDYILTDNPTAVYWEENSADAFHAVGKPLLYGEGFGIAVNPADTILLTSINQVLEQYEKSEEYKDSYDTHLSSF